MEAWEVEARLGVQDTLAAYVRHADGGRSRELAALFAEDGVLRTDTNELRGPAAIAAFLESTKASLAARTVGARRIRHHVSSLRMAFPSRDKAEATSYFLAVTASGPDHWGLYRDRLTRAGGRWLFVQRAAVVEGWVPGSWAEARRTADGTGPRSS